MFEMETTILGDIRITKTTNIVLKSKLSHLLGFLDQRDPVLLIDGGLQELPITVVNGPPAARLLTLHDALVRAKLKYKSLIVII